MDFKEVLIAFESMGLMDVLLPFTLIFAILFAVLSNINLFGKDRKNINVVVSLVLALTVVIPHVTGGYPPGADVVEIINEAIPNVTAIIVAVIMVLLLIGAWGIRYTGEGSSMRGAIVIFSLAAIIIIFGSAAGWFGSRAFSAVAANPETVAVVVALLVFGVIVWAITAEPGKPQGDSAFKKMWDDIGKSFEHYNK
ncbi:MAG: hypothetical protein QXW00_00405 [Candidatus Woesearchaeota archaeon]